VSGAARGLMLRVGQEVTATILDMVGKRVLLDLGSGGRRLAASVEADQPLAAGQTVRLQVLESTADHVTLRLLPSGVAAAPVAERAGEVLASLGLAGDELNQNIVAALVEEGLPLAPELVQDVRQAALSLQATSSEDVRAMAFLTARGLPLTAALVAVARQGEEAQADAAQLRDAVRQQASALLAALGPEGGDARLRQLLEQVGGGSAGVTAEEVGLGSAGVAAEEAGLASAGVTAEGLSSALAELTTSVEAALGRLVADEEGESDKGSTAAPASGEQAAHAGPSPEQVDNTELGPPRLFQGSAGTREQVAVRELVLALDRTIEDGHISGAQAAAAAELRETARELTHAVQGQQLRNVVAAGRGEPLVLPLIVPAGQGRAEVRLFVEPDASGAPKVDPENLRVSIELELSRLKRVSVDVQLWRGRMACQMRADEPLAQAVLDQAAPELRASLAKLGLSVEPIRCVLGAGELEQTARPKSTLASVNVRA